MPAARRRIPMPRERHGTRGPSGHERARDRARSDSRACSVQRRSPTLPGVNRRAPGRTDPTAGLNRRQRCASPPARTHRQRPLFDDDPSRRSPPIQVHGNTTGLKASQVKALERLGRRRLSDDRIVTNELARELTELSNDVRRQVGVLLDRSGSVQHVMLGTGAGIELPDWGRLRAGRGRLRGLRLIHTHLAGEGLTRDDETDLALLRLDAVVSIEVREDGLPGLAHAASLAPANEDGRSIEKLDPCHPADYDFEFGFWIRDLENELARATENEEVADGERAILVSVTAGRDRETLEMHVDELRELARAAGVHVVDVVTQSRPKVDPRTVIGSGKLSDLVIRCFQSDIDLVIFDQDISPAQARNLSERMELRVIDRTQLILDIFAQRATTGDGKLQVELAQLRYRMPRLAQRADLSLSRLAGGIGGRGPGETKLESDRRRVRDRITRLEREADRLTRQREGRRRSADRCPGSRRRRHGGGGSRRAALPGSRGTRRRGPRGGRG